MKARITYVLFFVLLLAMTWRAGNMTPVKAACAAPYSCCEHIVPASSVPLYIRLSAEVNIFTYTMEPVSHDTSLQKALLRQRCDIFNLRPEDARPDNTARPKRSGSLTRTVDYYVFSLERILV